MYLPYTVYIGLLKLLLNENWIFLDVPSMHVGANRLKSLSVLGSTYIFYLYSRKIGNIKPERMVWDIVRIVSPMQ